MGLATYPATDRVAVAVAVATADAMAEASGSAGAVLSPPPFPASQNAPTSISWPVTSSEDVRSGSA